MYAKLTHASSTLAFRMISPNELTNKMCKYVRFFSKKTFEKKNIYLRDLKPKKYFYLLCLTIAKF